MDTISECIREVKVWMSSNRLKLNDGKTDVMLITHEKTPVTDMPNALNDKSQIKFNDSVPQQDSSSTWGWGPVTLELSEAKSKNRANLYPFPLSPFLLSIISTLFSVFLLL